MPLAFESQSHGTVAFGFFNIAIDMLLLERLFFFADRFCRAVEEVAAGGRAAFSGWHIDDPARVGDLHGAIAGVNLSGFIGATYRKFPFPSDPEDFRQHTDGWRNQGWAAERMAEFGKPREIALLWDAKSQTVHFGDYRFGRRQFVELITYVDRGGYPRWEHLLRPPYVQEMMRRLAECGSSPWQPT